MKKLKKLLSILIVVSCVGSFAMAKEKKPAKITSEKLNTLKGVMKIAEDYNMEVLKDEPKDLLYVAKSAETGDYAIYVHNIEKKWDIQFAMVFINGEPFSRTVFSIMQKSGKCRSILNENDRNVKFDKGANNVYLSDYGVKLETVYSMADRVSIRTAIAKDFDLFIPENMSKNDANFWKVFSENIDAVKDAEANSESYNILQKIIDSNFVY